MTNQDPFEPPTHATTPVGSDGSQVPVARPVTVPVAQVADVERSLFRLERSSALSVWIDTGILILCIVAFEVCMTSVAYVGTGIGAAQSAISSSDFTDLEGAVTRTVLVPMLLLRAAVTCGIIWVIVTTRKQGRVSVGLGCRNGLVDVGIGVAALPVVFGLIYLVMLPIMIFCPALREQMGQNIGRITAMVPKLSLIGFCLFALVIGFYEELIFRGFLLTRLRRGTSSWFVAVILSSILFTLPHAMDQTTIALVPVGILALSFSALTIWRRSIIPSVVAHWLWNFSQFVMVYYILKA